MADLKISQLSKAFGTIEALRDISIDIEAGEFVCLLGSSGCGKTTLLRLIAGLESHDHGEMTLAGQDLTAIPSHKRGIGMVFQSLALFPHLNVSNNIGYGLNLRGEDRATVTAEVDRLLDMVGLCGLGERQISALSGGQRQRVAIARALALKPQIFLMDEPFSALDAALRDQMQNEVKRIQQELGVTTIFVTHDQKEAMALADRIAIMHDAKIVQVGTPDELYAKPNSKFVADFFETNNVLQVSVDNDGVYMGTQFLGARAIGVLASGTNEIAIRPEAIELLKSDESPQTPGTLINQRRLGALIEREVNLGGQIILQSAFVGQGETFEIGDRVDVRMDLSKAWVLSG